MMTVQDLRAILDDMVETHGEQWAAETPVTVGYQSSYPLEAELHGLTEASPANEAEHAGSRGEDEPDEDEDSSDPETPTKIVILTGSDKGYGSKWWWDAAID